MGQSLFKDEGKKKKSKPIPGRLFVFFHCYDLLCNEEKWKTRDRVDVLAKNAAQAAINLDRSEERRVGKECLRLCRSRWSPYH